MTRGGPRTAGPGKTIGRPATSNRIAISVRLPAWLVEWLRAQPESQAALIEAALVAKHRLTPPR